MTHPNTLIEEAGNEGTVLAYNSAGCPANDNVV